MPEKEFNPYDSSYVTERSPEMSEFSIGDIVIIADESKESRYEIEFFGTEVYRVMVSGVATKEELKSGMKLDDPTRYGEVIKGSNAYEVAVEEGFFSEFARQEPSAQLHPVGKIAIYRKVVPSFKLRHAENGNKPPTSN